MEIVCWRINPSKHLLVENASVGWEPRLPHHAFFTCQRAADFTQPSETDLSESLALAW